MRHPDCTPLTYDPTLMIALTLILAFSVTVCEDAGSPGIIGAGGGCWSLVDYENLYGDPSWYGQYLEDVGAWSHEEHMQWIIRQTWPDHLENTAIALATCESGLNPDAGNFTGRDLTLNNGSVGLFQIGVKFWPYRSTAAGVEGSAIRNPWANSIVAEWLFRTGGPRHWFNCSRRIGALT